jgi:hypothetical protein
VPNTGEIPQSTGDGLVSEALGDDPQHAEPGEPRLEVVKRLIRDLPVGELEALKQWFREYCSAVIVSQSAPDATPAKTGRGRPKGSTIASGARLTTHKTPDRTRTLTPAAPPKGEQLSLIGINGRRSADTALRRHGCGGQPSALLKTKLRRNSVRAENLTAWRFLYGEIGPTIIMSRIALAIAGPISGSVSVYWRWCGVTFGSCQT